jgi:hypothetical protein
VTSPKTAPKKRLKILFPQFKETITGITIAKAIGIPRMREHCPLFNEWVNKIENIPHNKSVM